MSENSRDIKPARKRFDLPNNEAVHQLNHVACAVLVKNADGLTIEQAGQLANLARNIVNKLHSWRFTRPV